MKVFRIVKAFVGLASAPSPDASAMAEAIKSNRPTARPQDTLADRRKANESLANELQKSHSPIGPKGK